MKRREFLRVCGWALAAVWAGTPLLRAWREAVERHQRQLLVQEQLRRQFDAAVRAMARSIGEQLYGSSVHRLDTVTLPEWNAGGFS